MSNHEQGFILSQEILSEMFAVDKIRDKSSLKLLQELGSIPGLCEALKTNIQRGISSAPQELAERERLYGNNYPYTRERESIFSIIWGALQDFVLRVLIIAAIISLVIGSIQDPDSG